MPKWMTFAFALFLSMQVFSTEGKEVDHAISNYINAMGGTERLHSMRSVYMEGMVTASDESSASSNIAAVINTFFNGHAVSNGSIYSDQFGSNKNKIKLERRSGNLFAFSVNLHDCSLPLVDYDGKRQGAELAGGGHINGRQAIKLKLTLNQGEHINYYLDAKSWYLLRREHFIGTSKQNPATCVEKVDYLNYSNFEPDLIFPSTMVLNHPKATLTILILQLNK